LKIGRFEGESIVVKRTPPIFQMGIDIDTTVFTASRDTGRSVGETGLRFGGFGSRSFLVRILNHCLKKVLRDDTEHCFKVA
jgi:hypothetical protein